MKIVNLFNDYRPCRKCGVETAALGIAAASAAGGIANAAIGNSIASGNVGSQLAAQKEENQLNRDWQTSEAEKARQFSASQTLQQNQFTSQLQERQAALNAASMKQQAYYNSPAYQRAQLEAAGINPQVYFGSSSSFSGSSALSGGALSAPSPSSAHGVGSVQGLSPVSFQPRDLQIGLYGTQLAQQIKDLADAKKVGVETGFLPDKTVAEITALNSQSSLNQVLTVGEHIKNTIARAKLPYAYKMAALEVDKAVSELKLNEQNLYTSKSVQKVNEALEKLHNAQENLTNRQAQKIGIEMPLYFQYLKSCINKNSADAVESASSAELNRANAAQVRFYNEVLSSDGVKSSLVQQAKQAGQAAVNANKISERQAKQLDYMISQAAYADDMKEFTYWSDQIQGFIGTVAEGVSSFYQVGVLKQLMNLRSHPNTIESGKGFYIGEGGQLFKQNW